MKRNITTPRWILILCTIIFLGLTSCSEWTDPESLDIDSPSFEEQNPLLYARYLESLCAYKAGTHKVLYAKMDNPSGAVPLRPNDHLTNLPDSIDVIILANPDELDPILTAEFAEVRKKGTKIIYDVDYDEIESSWKELTETEIETVYTEEDFITYCSLRVNQAISLCDKYGYDGLEVSFSGRSPLVLPDADADVNGERATYERRQNTFFGPFSIWHKQNGDKLMVFRGMPQNLMDKSFLDECSSIVLPASDANRSGELTMKVRMATDTDVPTDRFIVEVCTPTPSEIAEPDDYTGYFSNYESDGSTRQTAVRGAAQWVVIPESDYAKIGISVIDVQNDYYNMPTVYKNIRSAIDIMNPSPKK